MARLARWESKGGAHWAELHEERPPGKDPYYHYDSPGAFGIMAAKSAREALTEIEPKLQPGFFHPDTAKHPMQLVDAATSNRIHAIFRDRRASAPN